MVGISELLLLLEVVPYSEGVKGGAEGSTEELSGVVSGKVCEGWKGGGRSEGMRGGEAISLLRSHEWFLLWSLVLPQLVLVHISIAPLSMPTSAA